MLSFHKVHKAIASGMVYFYFVRSNINPADILSKHWSNAAVWDQLCMALHWQGDTAKLFGWGVSSPFVLALPDLLVRCSIIDMRNPMGGIRILQIQYLGVPTCFHLCILYHCVFISMMHNTCYHISNRGAIHMPNTTPITPHHYSTLVTTTNLLTPSLTLCIVRIILE